MTIRYYSSDGYGQHNPPNLVLEALHLSLRESRDGRGRNYPDIWSWIGVADYHYAAGRPEKDACSSALAGYSDVEFDVLTWARNVCNSSLYRDAVIDTRDGGNLTTDFPSDWIRLIRATMVRLLVSRWYEARRAIE